MNPISTPLERAIELRCLGEKSRRVDGPAALAHYEEAAEILRDLDEPLLLAHTLRHLGDVYMEAGHLGNNAPQFAGCYFTEALAIYRTRPEANPLDLADAIRSLALLRNDAALWTEARDLYALAGISANVQECNSRLGAC